jgi:hypothetical protein
MVQLLQVGDGDATVPDGVASMQILSPLSVDVD